MSRKKIVAGNWKMNGNLDEAIALVKSIIAESAHTNVMRMVFPPFPYLKTVSDLLQGIPDFYCGAQNCSRHEKGAFTGEVSATMIKNVGCSHVLVGHSERRSLFAENSAELVEKILQAHKNKLGAIFCFGEQLDERKAGRHFETVKQQLQDVLPALPEEIKTNIILAYEPVWAIGTGETATPSQAQEMHAFIRRWLAENTGRDLAGNMSILYGGSCNAQNAAELFACPDVDGGLIGGASLKAADFCKIIASF